MSEKENILERLRIDLGGYEGWSDEHPGKEKYLSQLRAEIAWLEKTTMKFTDTLPTEPGLYWAIYKDNIGPPQATEIVDKNGERFVWASIAPWPLQNYLWGDKIEIPEVEL